MKTPGEAIVRGHRAAAILADATVIDWFKDEDDRALARIIDAKTEDERIQSIADVKARRALRRALEMAVHAGQQMEKKERNNA